MSGVLGPGPGAAARMRQAAADLHARTGRTACNGSLMRTSPVALARLGDPDAIAQAATAVSALTRADPVAGDACVLWCLAIDRARSAQLLSATLLGAGGVATGFLAGIRQRAVGLLEDGFLPRVRELLRTAGVLHVDETPGRAAGGMAYVHVACTEFLTALHTGTAARSRSTLAGCCPATPASIVRDWYAGYQHLVDAVHAWCGAHLIRDLRAIHDTDQDGQVWARALAGNLLDAHHAAQATRAAGQAALDEPTLARTRRCYQGAVAKGLTDNHDRRGGLTRDALTVARRLRDHEDMILRFAADLTVPFSNNQAERTRDRSRSSSGPPAAAGEPSKASPASPSCSPAYPPPPSGAWTNSTCSVNCSPPALATTALAPD